MSESNESFGKKLVDIFTNWRVLLLVFFVFMSIFAINFQFEKGGVVINGVSPKSPAEMAGISYDSEASLTDLERISFIDNTKINTISDYYSALNEVTFNSTILLGTVQNPLGYSIDIGELSQKGASEKIGISVRDAPVSNIRLGIELEGGSRLILKPTRNITSSQFDLLVNTLQSRLDVYGASGTKVNKLEDSFSNEKFIIVESISSNKNDIFELIKRQGNFEAKIANVTVFTGDDIVRVLNDPSHEIFEGCSNRGEGDEGYSCTYSFAVEVSNDAGERFFNVTKNLEVEAGHLSEKVFFYLDGNEVTSLSIASSFKYRKITSPQITISEKGATEELAFENTQREMKFLQAILSTKSLPSELEVVQSYSISSSMGQTLLSNAIWVGLIALLLVASVVALRYRKIVVFVGILCALLTEVMIVFGVAAFLKLSIDLAAIGGLIAAIGTGVDDQIIITDEYFRNRKKSMTSRKKIKAALYIIMIAYLTTLAAMIPLYFAGLKILQGFAFMIIVGVTVGVFITRPAYAAYLRIITTSRKERVDEDE